MLSPFSISPQKSPIPSPSSCLCEGAPQPTHRMPLPYPHKPLHWGIEPSRDQGPHLPLMPNKASSVTYTPRAMCHSMCIACLVVRTYCCSSYGVATPFGPFSNSSTGDPVISSMVGCEQPLLYMSCSCRASQETAISGSCQHVLLGIHNRVCIW